MRRIVDTKSDILSASRLLIHDLSGKSGDVPMMKSSFVAPNSIWRELDLRNINQRKQMRQDGTNTNDLKKT